MRQPFIQRFFVAWMTGAVVGVAALSFEWLFLGSRPDGPSVAAYSLIGGALAAIGRSAAAVALAAHPARLATMFGLAAFAALEVLYFVNVHLLPAEHYLSAKSLAADFVVLAAFLGPFLALGNSSRASAARTRLGPVLAATGVLALVSATYTLARSSLTVEGETLAPRREGLRDLDVYVIVLDSVRQDRTFGADGPRLTPTLQRLMREGRTYGSAFAASSWTVPSVAEMLWSGAAHESERTLAQQLAAAGWTTASFTDNPHLWRGSSLLRGFSRVSRSVGAWREPVRATVLGEVVERLMPGDDLALAARIKVFLAEARRPVFLYAHLMDAHAPYRFARLDGKRSRGRRIEFPLTGMAATPDEAEDVRARYDAGVRRTDSALSQIVAAVRERGRPYLLVVTADHGESLGESGRWFHGGSLAPELISVPLVVLGETRAAGRVDSPVSNGQVPQTVLSAVGLRCTDCATADLRSATGGVVQGGLPPDLGYRIGDGFKLVVDRRTGARQLFELSNDPQERRNVLADHPRIAEALSDGLAAPAVPSRPPEDALERLRALGYAAP